MAVFDGENADPNGRRMEADLLARTTWGGGGRAVGRAARLWAHLQQRPSGDSAPGAETLRELMGERPVLILMDELSIDLRKLKGAAIG